MRGEVSTTTAGPPATKSPFLLMTNQNQISPALHLQNQPFDSGSIHETQRQELFWLSLHRSHRRTCCVLFSLGCLTCAAPPANHLVPSLQNPYKSRVSLVEYENFPAREVCGLLVLTKLSLRMGRVPSMRGRYRIKIAQGWKWQRIYSYKWVRFARADKAVALQHHYR